MAEIDYVIREDGNPELFTPDYDSDFLDTLEILNNYPYILDAMKKEKYYLENEICHSFDEILYENKVVGFSTFDVREGFEVLLTECFILPEFRGKRLFFNELCKMIFVAPVFGIIQPTRNIVELLLRYSFAKNFTEDIVVSGIKFYFDYFDVKTNEQDEVFDENLPSSNFYDLGICSTVFVENDEVYYHDLLENDLMRYGDRKELTQDYFLNIKEIFSNNSDEFKDLINEVENELPDEKLDYSIIVGEGEGLSDYMQDLVDGDLFSFEKAMEIKEQLIREYEAGEIDDKTIDDRFTRLAFHAASDNLELEEVTEFLDSYEGDDEEVLRIKQFLDLIGEDKEFGINLLSAVMGDDEEKFENVVMNQILSDDEFSHKFAEFIEEFEDEELSIADVIGGYNKTNKFKLDDTIYGKDYPISYDIDIYRILYLLNAGAEYAMILEIIDLEISSDIQHLTILMQYSNYIRPGIYLIDWDDAGSKLSKKDLIEILKDNGLKTDGNKKTLIKRLKDNQVGENESFVITQEGQCYLKENSWIEYYMVFLHAFDFNDFYKYLDTHEGTLKEISLNYLDEHIKLAKELDDDEYLECCLESRVDILDDADEIIEDYNIEYD